MYPPIRVPGYFFENRNDDDENKNNNNDNNNNNRGIISTSFIDVLHVKYKFITFIIIR